MDRSGLPRDTSPNQDQEPPSGYYSPYDPQQHVPTRHNRVGSHQSASHMTSFLGSHPESLGIPTNHFEGPYAATSMQPGSLADYLVSQSQDTSTYPPQMGTQTPYYNQAGQMPDSSSGALYSMIPHQEGADLTLNLAGPHGYAQSESIAESRRPTLTQQGYRDSRRRDLARRNVGPETSTNPVASYQAPRTDMSRLDTHRHIQTSAPRPHKGNQTPYDRRETIKPTTPGYAAVQDFQVSHQRTPSGASLEYGSSPGYSGAIAIPQLPAVNSRSSRSPGFPIGWPESGQMSQSLPAPSPSPFMPDYSMSNIGTPASTEGSADPAQSDQEDLDALITASSPTSNSTSTSASSTASRWARFRVPSDIFTNPADPARHELYHRIRQEPWFAQQVTERALAPHEAERIPGSQPGESVLLAFYDRIQDNANKVSMKCTICAQTNPGAQLYPRPDRAKVHMRHHFELRPIRCNGSCNSPQCTQRFFTHSDLTAHVTGKTEPLATCPKCGKTMRQKNLKRHTSQYCQGLNNR